MRRWAVSCGAGLLALGCVFLSGPALADGEEPAEPSTDKHYLPPEGAGKEAYGARHDDRGVRHYHFHQHVYGGFNYGWTYPYGYTYGLHPPSYYRPYNNHHLSLPYYYRPGLFSDSRAIYGKPRVRYGYYYGW